MDTESAVVWPSWCYSGEPAVPQSINTAATRLVKSRIDRSIVPNSTMATDFSNNNNVNNNNNIKNERLSPGTPDTSSRSPTVTPSSASHPGTPPSNEQMAFPGCRNYSEFMRSLAAKYQATDYFNAARNGITPPLHPRLKPSPYPMMPQMPNMPQIPNIPQLPNMPQIPSIPQRPPSKENDQSMPKPDYATLLNPLLNRTLFPPIMDMTATQALVALLKNAADDENQNLLKHVQPTKTKRRDALSPLDLSAGATPLKKSRTKCSSSSSSSGGPKRAQSESPSLGDDFKNWSVDEVANFVASIDICAEYAPIGMFTASKACQAEREMERIKFIPSIPLYV